MKLMTSSILVDQNCFPHYSKKSAILFCISPAWKKYHFFQTEAVTPWWKTCKGTGDFNSKCRGTMGVESTKHGTCLNHQTLGFHQQKCGFQPLEPWKFEDQESSCRGCRVTTSRLRLCSTNYQCFSTDSWNVCTSQAMLGALEAIPSRVYIKHPHSMIPPINGISPINFLGVTNQRSQPFSMGWPWSPWLPHLLKTSPAAQPSPPTPSALLSAVATALGRPDLGAKWGAWPGGTTGKTWEDSRLSGDIRLGRAYCWSFSRRYSIVTQTAPLPSLDALWFSATSLTLCRSPVRFFVGIYPEHI